MVTSTPPAAQLREILQNRALDYLFQPIFDLSRQQLLGYEALMRGPAGSPLHAPEALLSVARAAGLSLELELTGGAIAVERFAHLGLPGKLFLNASAGAICRVARDLGGPLLHSTVGAGFFPGRLVVELTEHERVSDFDAMTEAAATLRGLGIQLALDDFGDGRSSLRLWAQIQPEIVKVDKYFTHHCHRDSRKVAILRSIHQLASAFGTPLVAEGVEEAAELEILRDLGFAHAQGYFLGRPVADPPRELHPEALAVLTCAKVAVLPVVPALPEPGEPVERLLVHAPTVAPEMTNDTLVRLFVQNPRLHAVAVVDREVPVGLVNRRDFLDKYAQPYHPELYGRRPCTLFMNAQPLRVEAHIPLADLATILTGEDQSYLRDGLIITRGGRYAGLATGESLVRKVTEQRVEAARHANPLTFLPGNIPITEHIRRLLAHGASFAAAYFDLNNFKPYNDLYGYWRGDQMIKLAAATITRHCEPRHDFVGHVGGDDFVVLFQSEDWQSRCQSIVKAFNQAARDLFDAAELARGGMEGEDRRGVRTFFPLTTVAVGVVRVAAGDCRSPEDVASSAAAAKKLAKEQGDGFYQLVEQACCANLEDWPLSQTQLYPEARA
ncbi:MAG: EAL domain-containing protein [Rhodocyclaceae bacterium]|jgi:diguanylate cyclase (GGDEF)-like protein|nr:EAL domain-containing protein [Rhodocyclaceae bacterium]